MAKLPTLWALQQSKKTPGVTTHSSTKTPENTDFQTIWQTSVKLKQYAKLLGGLGLLNKKYLLQRNNIYYFVIKVNGHVVIKSLHTDNFVIANLLKLKILIHLYSKGLIKMNNYIIQLLEKIEQDCNYKELQQLKRILYKMLDNSNKKMYTLIQQNAIATGLEQIYNNIKVKNALETLEQAGVIEDKQKFIMQYTVNRGNNVITIEAETEIEQKLLAEIEATIRNKLKRLEREGYKIKINDTTKGTEPLKLKDILQEFLQRKEIELGKNSSTYKKYRQSVDLLNLFFRNELLKNVTPKRVNKFILFLQSLPRGYKINAQLKKMDMLALYKKGKLPLPNYETLEKRTISDFVKRYKTIFNYIEENYNYNNPFKGIKLKLKENESSWKEFTLKEFIIVINYLIKKQEHEITDFLFFLFATGLRRSEAFNIKISDIDLENMLINVKGTKTQNAKRLFPIYCLIELIIRNRLNNNTYLFFDTDNKGKRINENYLSVKINKYITEALGKNNKKGLNLHSLRKNFAQALHTSENLKDYLVLKTLLGHSTSKDITDKAYIRNKRNWKHITQQLNEIIGEEGNDLYIIYKAYNYYIDYKSNLNFLIYKDYIDFIINKEKGNIKLNLNY